MIKKAADGFFRWFCDPDYYPDIKGDLEELYIRNLHKSKRHADRKYLFRVLGLFRPSLIKSFNRTSIINQDMFRNYFTIGSRNLLRHKLYTFINVVGLAFGLASFLLISEYVRFEKGYDGFFENSNQIYRLSTVEMIDGKVGTKDAMTFQPAAQVIADELPEVLLNTTTYKFDDIIVKKGTEIFKEKNVISADSNFLKVFSHPVLQGSRESMLNEPNSLVLTKSKAEFYFGNEDPIGKTLNILDSFNRPFKVTGVIADVPDNTHYKFDLIISDKSITDRLDYNNWNAYNYYAYLVLDPITDMDNFQKKLDMVSRKYREEDFELHFSLFPVKDIHLKSDFTFEPEIPGNAKAVSVMAVISIFILIIAWVNYINLSTARAVERAKEVGLRKVIGAYKSQIILQFLFESLMVNFIAAAFAFFVVEFSLSYFYNIIGTSSADHIWNHLPIMENLLIFFVLGTLVSGFYPALVLSAFKPVSVLKGKFSHSNHGIILRKGLVVVQFAASVALIAGTFIVNKQVKFMQSKDLGISVDYTIGFYLPDVQEDLREVRNTNVNSFKEELRNYNGIKAVGSTSNLPGGDGSDINSTSTHVRIEGLSEPAYGTIYVQYIDDEFTEAVNIRLATGRDFDRNIKSDSSAIMVNEAFLRKYNIYDPDSALGQYLMFGENEQNSKYNIIGVVRDFHRTSLKSNVEPTIYWPWMDADAIVVKLNPESYREAIPFVESKWKELFPDAPFDYTFLDDRFAKLYEQDRRFGDIFMIFSILAIVIAMLGLYGLSSFMAIQRTKEVGVRKVLGASVPSIIGIFFRDFALLLAFAVVIGVPLVYSGINFWLENYAFRISFPWSLTLLSVLIVIGFALLTVGYQTFKVAVLNPADTLRYE